MLHPFEAQCAINDLIHLFENNHVSSVAVVEC